MLKKLIIFVLFFLIIVLTSAVFLNSKLSQLNKNQPSESGQITPFSISPVVTSVPTFDSNNNLKAKDFTVEWIIVRDPKKVFLYTNLEDKLSSSAALSKYGCNQLISGGFYTKEGQNLGLLISDGNILEKSIKSKLFDAFFYITKDDKFGITQTEPDNINTKVALQSGPLLIKDTKPITLNIDNDENARRVVVAITQKGEIAFLILYYKPSPLLGPKLEELPNLLDKIQFGTNLKFKNALNLDGGSHSAFIAENVRVSEVSTPGTYFCIKP